MGAFHVNFVSAMLCATLAVTVCASYAPLPAAPPQQRRPASMQQVPDYYYHHPSPYVQPGMQMVMDDAADGSVTVAGSLMTERRDATTAPPTTGTPETIALAATVEPTTAKTTTTTTGNLSSNAIDEGTSTTERSRLAFPTGSLLGSSRSMTTTPSSKRKKPSTEKGNFDKHLDGIVANLGKALRQNGFDPIHIGNILQCSNCSMEGLSLIRRSGPSNFAYANRTVTVDAELTMPALYISCFPCVDVILMVPLSGMLEVALWGLTIYGKVTQKVTKGASPSLVDYEVLNEGELDISFNARGLLAPITEFGFKVIRQRQVSDIIREFVYDRVPKFVRRRLKSFTSPIGK